MASNTFGTLLRLSTFGESHGIAIGGVLDGMPAGLNIDLDFVQAELNKRRPGQSQFTTSRNEEDEVEFLSGIFEGVSTGTPIGFIIRNKDSKSNDYSHLQSAYRPSHADFTYEKKFGVRDFRGGGRSSARETACRVVAGALAKLLLSKYNIQITAFVNQIGSIRLTKNYHEIDLSLIENNPVRCPDEPTALQMMKLINETKEKGDTLGGTIQCVIQNLPIGLGEPVFDKFDAVMAHAMMSINATKGFEIGSGFSSIDKNGSQLNDVFINDNGIKTKTNHSGGVQGGITNGMPVYFNVAFKPVATIMQSQESVNSKGETITLESKGRHDACVLPRAVPIVESMAALVTADFLLLSRGNKF